MRIFSPRWMFLFIYLTLSPSIWAHPFEAFDPDDLAKKSILVCNGRVESITEGITDNASDFLNSITHFTAKIRVLHVFNGEAPHEIEIHYTKSHEPADGPIEIYLEKEERYRFFLQKGLNNLSFIGVLDGKYEAGFAAEQLAPKEIDDSPYITQS